LSVHRIPSLVFFDCSGAVLQAASCGRLLLDEAAALVGMMESKRRAMETIDLEQRLQALEAESAGEDTRRKGGA